MVTLMFRRSLPAFFAAICLAAPLAHAQNGLSTRPNYDMIERANRIDENKQRDLNALHKAIVEALGAQDYAAAESTSNRLLESVPSTPDAHYLLGLAQSGLGKWSEAKASLEIAVREEPLRPGPKTRLGLAYVQLNELESARQQRLALTSLSMDCNKTCEDARWIAEGLMVLDEALSPERLNAAARALPPPAAVVPANGSATPGLPKKIDPAQYSLVTFQDQHDLYDLLTKDGRCPVKKLAEPRQPCALILYTPTGDGDGLSANFKPVFGVVSKKTIWAIHNKKLQKVHIEDLYFDTDDVIGQKRTTYQSKAVIGNEENRANCERGLPCLSNLVVQDMFKMYGNMPDSVVAVIWGGGMKDVATIRIR